MDVCWARSENRLRAPRSPFPGYVSLAGEMIAVPIEIRDGALIPGRATVLFSMGPQEIVDYEVSSDGKRFLILEDTQPGLTVRAILNWTEIE